MTSFLPCPTCGTYVAAEEPAPRMYCSRECARAYGVCVNCGKYFLKGEGHDSEHCSKACTIKYVILRKYGPQPVTVVAEV
jgi:endogenous inhibitor of DNA gyrase (YacG/DUF329 family)